MNKQLSNIDELKKFLERKWINAIDYADTRIREEKRSISRLVKRNDFLSRYNLAIRYMFIWFLKKGYDIRQDIVHPCLRLLLEQKMGLHYKVVKDIVITRNSVKYNRKKPTTQIYAMINDCVDFLKSINE